MARGAPQPSTKTGIQRLGYVEAPSGPWTFDARLASGVGRLPSACRPKRLLVQWISSVISRRKKKPTRARSARMGLMKNPSGLWEGRNPSHRGKNGLDVKASRHNNRRRQISFGNDRANSGMSRASSVYKLGINGELSKNHAFYGCSVESNSSTKAVTRCRLLS